MPTKPGSPSKRSKRAKEPQLELVVRRGALRRFNTLKAKTVDMGVAVTWDRRNSDRRTKASRAVAMEVPRDRRSSERRQKPPFTWELADFVLVTREAGGKAPGKKGAKKAGS